MRVNRKSINSGRQGITGLIGFVVVVGAASPLGCAQPPNTDSNLGAGPTGTVTVALETVGSDGATYQFPPGTALNVPDTSGTYDVGYRLDGTETVLTKTLPIGDYAPWVSFPDDGSPQLIRIVNGMSQTVPAILIDPQPFKLSIVRDTTTPLVLHLSAVGLGDVTFQIGRVRLSIEVSSTTTTMAAHGQDSATFTELRQSIAAGFGLETPLGLTTGETDAVSLTFDLTSAFVLTSPPRQVCANIALASITSPSGGKAFSALLGEVGGIPGAAGTLCITDFGPGAHDIAHIDFLRTGPAPADQQAFLPGTNYAFEAGGFFDVGGDILDDSSFQLSKLATPIMLDAASGASLFHQIEDLDTRQILEGFAGNLAGTFQLTP